MADKEILQKLLKIAEKQQKIITKLAQALPMGGATAAWEDVSDSVSALLASIPSAKGFTAVEMEVAPSTGALRGKLVYPAGNMKFNETVNTLKALLAGNTLKSSDGKDVKVTDNKNDVSFIGMTA